MPNDFTTNCLSILNRVILGFVYEYALLNGDVVVNGAERVVAT